MLTHHCSGRENLCRSLTVNIFSVIFKKMKKCLLFLFLSGYCLTGYAYGFDLAGIQPLAPYSVFSTFSAYSLDQGRTGMALGADISHRPSFSRFTAQWGYGITDKVELEMTIPYTVEWGTNGIQKTLDGFEDIGLVLKYRFFDEGRYGPAIALIFDGTVPSGRDEFTTDGSYGTGLIVTKKVGPVTGHLNLFYSRPGSSNFSDEVTLAAGFEFAATHSLKVLGELYGQKSYSGSLDRLELRFGTRILTTDNIFTTIGAGYDTKNRTPEYRILLSVSYMFPTKMKKIEQIEEKGD